jgi:hypothetical protein
MLVLKRSKYSCTMHKIIKYNTSINVLCFIVLWIRTGFNALVQIRIQHFWSKMRIRIQEYDEISNSASTVVRR